MRYATTSQLLEYIRQHPDCKTAEIVNAFYPAGSLLPCEVRSGRDSISTKLAGLRRRRWIINLYPGRQYEAVWRAVA